MSAPHFHAHISRHYAERLAMEDQARPPPSDRLTRLDDLIRCAFVSWDTSWHERRHEAPAP